MDARFKNIRRGVLGAGVLGMLGLFGYHLIHDNPERAELERELNALEGQLVQLKAIRRDQARYRQEHERVMEQLREGHRLFAEDLEVLSSSLAKSGTALKVQRPELPSDQVPRRYALPVRLTLEGTARDGLIPAFSAVAPRISSLARLELKPGGAWSMGLDCYAVVPLPPVGVPARSPPRWYSSLNDDLRQRITARQVEIDALRAELGDERDFGAKKRELEALSNVVEALAIERDDHQDLLKLLFLGDPILTSGTVTPSENGFKVQGLLAEGVDPASVPGRLSPAWKTASIGFHDRQLDLAVARAPKAPETP